MGVSTAERLGCDTGVVAILAVTLTIYGAATFGQEAPGIGTKTLSGRDLPQDKLQVTPLPLGQESEPAIFTVARCPASNVMVTGSRPVPGVLRSGCLSLW